MGVKVYYSEISGSKEVKKRQQRVMMILESKGIPYEAIDITEPGKEKDKEFMLQNAKPRGDSKIIPSPQIFKDDLYCGDYDAFDLANENDTLEEFLGSPKIENNIRGPSVEKTEVVNGKAGSREPSAEIEAKAPVESSNGNATEEIVNTPSDPQPTEEESRDVTDAVPSEEPPEEEKSKPAPAAEDEQTSAQETTKTEEEEEAGGDE